MRDESKPLMYIRDCKLNAEGFWQQVRKSFGIFIDGLVQVQLDKPLGQIR